MATAFTFTARRKTASKAFSLVEVCLALGIISFSLISMIALLPTGMSALRDSKDQMLHARILQQVCGDLQTTEASPTNGARYYFNSDGQWLGDSDPDRLAYYVVELSIELPSLPNLTGAAQNSFNDYLKRVRVGISKAQTSNTPNNSIKWYAIQIAKR
jgi:uncharacterized protein (TIGR02598 family)